MAELTKTQLFMIEQIEKTIERERERLEKADYKKKPEIRKKIENLKLQLEKAKQPFERTEEEKKLIEKIAENVKENIEVSAPNIEGDRSDKPLTSKEEFEYGMKMFIDEVKHRKEQLEKDLATQEGIVSILEQHEPVGDEQSYKNEISTRKNIISQMKMSLDLFNDRLAEDEIQIWALDNYDNLSRLNTYLNNPLKLKDYEDYVEELRKKNFEEK